MQNATFAWYGLQNEFNDSLAYSPIMAVTVHNYFIAHNVRKVGIMANKMNFQNGKAFTNRLGQWEISMNDPIGLSVRFQNDKKDLTSRIDTLNAIISDQNSASDKNALRADIEKYKAELEEKRTAYNKALGELRFEYTDAEKHMVDVLRDADGRLSKAHEYDYEEKCTVLRRWFESYGVSVPDNYDFSIMIKDVCGIHFNRNKRNRVNTGKMTCSKTQTEMLKDVFAYVADFMLPETFKKYVFSADVVKFYAPKAKKSANK